MNRLFKKKSEIAHCEGLQQKASYQLLLCQLEKAPKGVVSPVASTYMEVQNAGYGKLVALPLHTAMLFLADWCAQAACALQAAKKRRQCYCFWTPRRVGILIEDDKWILSCLMNVTIIARKCIKDTTRSLLNSVPLGFVMCYSEALLTQFSLPQIPLPGFLHQQGTPYSPTNLYPAHLSALILIQ